MKKFLLFLVFTLSLCAFAAEKHYAVGKGDLEITGSLTLLKDPEVKNHQFIRATNRRTVFSVLVKKYPNRKPLLFNTVRYLENGKPFVIEFEHVFETGRKYDIAIKFVNGKAELFLDGVLKKSKSYTGKFLNGSMRNVAKDPVSFTFDKVNDSAAAAAAEKKK